MDIADIINLKERIFGNTFLNRPFSGFYFSNDEKTTSQKQEEWNLKNNKKREAALEISVEELLEELLRGKIDIFRNKNSEDETLEEKTLQERIIKLNNTAFIVEEEKLDDKKIFLYEVFPNTYYVYVKRKNNTESERKEQKNEKSRKNEIYGSFGYFSLFVPTGVIVNRVPQNVLGTGVLGRAFIYSNYIEILDSLTGNEYTEVLTHELLHIMYPEKKEAEIRMMTRNYLGNTIYN